MQLIRRKLKNGITLLVEPRETPVVSMCIANPFGGAFELESEKGIAHFIEHLVFTGTKTRTHEDISKEIEKKGGELNAFTAHEVTSFWCTMPAEHAFAGLDVLIDIIQNPVFKKEKFEKEKKVILEEIKMYHDAPMRYVHTLLEQQMFGKPFGMNIIGTKETVNALQRDFVIDFYKKHYFASNYVVIAVGKIDCEELARKLESAFPARSGILKAQPIQLQTGRIIEEREGIDQAHLLMGMHAPLQHTPEYAVLEVLNAFLADGMSSRLFLHIREEKGLAYSVRGSIDAEQSYSVYSIYVGTTKAAWQEVEQLIVQGFKDIASMTAQQLEEVKQQLIGRKQLAQEASSTVMNELLFAQLCGKAEDYYTKEKRIRAVKLEDVKLLAHRLIKEYSVVAIIPK